MIWSAAPWRDAEVLKNLEMIGSAVTGRTDIAGTQVRVVGICIPYFGANPHGQLPRIKQWALHTDFILALAPMLACWRSEGPVIVAGDYNRRMPRVYGPKQSYELLEKAFAGYNIATRGSIAGVAAQTLDHVAFAGDFRPLAVEGRSAVSPDGRECSDHFGVIVDFELGG